MHLSKFLEKAAKKLAGRADDFQIDSLEGAKILEQIRASVFPPAQQIDLRKLELGVNLSGGLSNQALQEIERLARIM